MKSYVIKKFILGEDPTIETVLEAELNSSDTIVIEIRDPNNNVVISDTAMTQVSGRVYQYIYPTTTSGTAGVYTATIKVTNSSGDDYDRTFFEMLDYS